ncbi:acetyl-CoA C-acyltransferase [Candidatus Comchoanobacter bicostacola]|uniref:Acetyl-CoA C-acyltransferase n=1 Tax=Candidatus Comchoanobacter bicostacola TaxID=2919598 RepID=A0ABY5DMD9_9GAMM|nr:acetyl-CoA C-acyltransferase [Candidatus Comchoanobacter bicostacola]UTC24832.1 acetyl-CoA C-acyltransferase [Candidatus Comchoanobacter bicostacola]
MHKCYIVDSKRTPRGIGKESGGLHTVSSLSLLSQTLEATVPYALKPFIEDLITGCVMPVGEQGANIARSALLRASFPDTVPGMQINRFCSSGLDAIALCASKIMAGQQSLNLAAGIESMSRVPMLSDGGALVADPSIAMQHNIIPQGISADLIATIESYTREQLDQFAVDSHKKALNAIKRNYLKSIIPIYHASGIEALTNDEVPRNCNSKALSSLQPSFELIGNMAGYNALALNQYPEQSKINHLHHAGNSSALADGATATLLASETAIHQHGLKPRAQIIAFDQIGTDPTIMLTAPAASCKRLLEKCKLHTSDIDLWEINEAFSAVALKFIQELNLEASRVNVNGGAIAYGHPLGATGGMLVGTIVDELTRRQLKRGVVTLCTAAGMAASMLIERVE